MFQSHHLVRSSLLVLVFSALSKVTGFVKLLLMTSFFGTSPAADAFAAAAQLPELLQAMLLGGALSAALMPVYSAYLMRQDERRAQVLARTVLTLTLIVSTIVCGVAALMAHWLVSSFLVPDFSTAQKQVTTELMRILLLAMGLVSIGSVTSTLLHARQLFWAPALGTVLIDIGQVLGIYFLAPRWGIHGAAWGSVIGVSMLVGIQIPSYLRHQIGFVPHLALRLAGLREVLHLIWPRIITLGAYQAADLVFIRLASRLPDGVISAYFFAMLVMVGMPKSLFLHTISTVLLPTLANQFNLGKLDELKRTVAYGLQAVLGCLIPAAAGLVALGPSAIAFLFERGAFDQESTAMVYSLVAILSLRLIGESAGDVLMLPFYAHHNTRIPMVAHIGWMILSVALYHLLIGPFGIWGMALATSLAALALLAVMIILYRCLLGPLDSPILIRGLGRILMATGCMMAVVIALQMRLSMSQPIYMAGTILTGGLTYILMLTLLGGGELRWVIGQLQTSFRLKSKKRQAQTTL